jgi:SAM-dependent methyltransferase
VAAQRRLAFGSVAELYDSARPSYPAALIDEVLELAPEAGLRRALEVGSGTGKATVLFAQRGVPVLGLEPSAGMAAIARRNCERFESVRIEESEFETWEPRGERFPLLFSGQAWHWTAPEVRYVKAKEVLEPGGLLAPFWNRPVWARSTLREQLDQAYQRAVPELTPGESRPMHPGRWAPEPLGTNWDEEIGGSDGFERPEVRSYEWRATYTTEEYLRLLQTHSDHIVLADDRRAALLDAVGEVLERNGGGLELDYIASLCLAWRCK